MLVLSRRIHESIRIADQVTVTVLAVSGNTVRIGINAPEDISVHREEVYARIKGEDKANSTEGLDSPET